MNPGKRFQSCGVTLVEMLITILLISILATAIFPVAQLAKKRQQETELKRALREIRSGIDAYKKAVDEGKVAKRADESGYPPKLESLVGGVPNAKVPGGPSVYFLRRIPADPMADGNEHSTVLHWGKRSYVSSPQEPKEGVDVYDVYSKASGIGINGIPYREW